MKIFYKETYIIIEGGYVFAWFYGIFDNQKQEVSMFKRPLTILVAVVVSVSLIAVSGCQNDAQTGALIGSGLGAGIGALAGGDTEATLIGAAIGGGAGYIFGNEQDKKKTAQQINAVTVNVTNSNGSVIPVRLARQGTGYLGPRGEYYNELPTQEQLRPVYGF